MLRSWMLLLLLATVRASVDNVGIANALQERAVKLNGRYLVKSADSTKALYKSPGKSFDLYPSADTQGSVIVIEAYGNGTNWVTIKTEEADCCLSAQWDVEYDGVSDWAGVCYRCQLGDTSSTLRPDKQLWLLVPLKTPSTFAILPTDHQYDMLTRALTSNTRKTQGKFQSIALEVYKEDDPTQQWILEALDGDGMPVNTKVTVQEKAAAKTQRNREEVLTALTKGHRTAARQASASSTPNPDTMLYDRTPPKSSHSLKLHENMIRITSSALFIGCMLY